VNNVFNCLQKINEMYHCTQNYIFYQYDFKNKKNNNFFYDPYKVIKLQIMKNYIDLDIFANVMVL